MAIVATKDQRNVSLLDGGLLTEKQAAELIGFSRGALRASRVTGKLGGLQAPPWLKIGRSIRYRRTMLDAWLSEAAVEHHAPSLSHA